MNLKEYLDRTRFDTGITTEEMIQGIRKINLDDTMRLIEEDSKKGNKSMMVQLFTSLMDEVKKNGGWEKKE